VFDELLSVLGLGDFKRSKNNFPSKVSRQAKSPLNAINKRGIDAMVDVDVDAAIVNCVVELTLPGNPDVLLPKVVERLTKVKESVKEKVADKFMMNIRILLDMLKEHTAAYRELRALLVASVPEGEMIHFQHTEDDPLPHFGRKARHAALKEYNAMYFNGDDLRKERFSRKRASDEVVEEATA
jgi:hypothetical protein